MGLELLRLGDPQRALDAFLGAVARRQNSKRRARIYGMWLENYFPYFEIARAHAAVGNWKCVADALTLSSQHGEIMADDDEHFEFLDLKAEVATHKK